MKLKIMNIDKTEMGSISLPSQFDEAVRPDLIKRAVLSIQANIRQPYGASPEAGKRHSAELSRRRRKYRGSYGHGISRIPRKILSRRGTRMNWVGALAPGTVGGRRAHPPKAEKMWDQKINTKERRKAVRSALAATINIEEIRKRGHIIGKEFPFIVEDKLETLNKTAEVKNTLGKLGFKEELSRISKRTIRPGKGTLRGRKQKTKKGPLLVVSKDCQIQTAAANLKGVDVVRVDLLNVEMLAPGTHQGRLTIYTQGAITRLSEEGLFNQEFKEEKIEKQEKNTLKEAKKKGAPSKATKSSKSSKTANTHKSPKPNKSTKSESSKK